MDEQNYYTNLQEELITEIDPDKRVLLVESVASGADELAKVLNKKTFIQYDTVTGLYRLGKETATTAIGYTEREAKNFFMIVVAPLVRIITGKANDGVRSRGTNKNEQEQLWEAIKHCNKINSRLEEYLEIPEWDGTERIVTFMKDYFECKCEHNEFLLFMTCVMAKWKNPEVHVSYWFDFIGEAKGTGKTSLFGHLFGSKAMILGVPSRKEDLFVSAYRNGALVVCDDECTWIGKGPGKMTYDEYKSVVTMQVDTFSPKFGQPESHHRPFVIVRTSNDPRTVFSTNERRQIIFNVGLKERECRHWDMTEEYRIQLLAEAKHYVETHDGQPYHLTKEEAAQIEANNLENYDTNTDEYQVIFDFLTFLHRPTEERNVFCFADREGNVYTNWAYYRKWCKKNFYSVTDSRIFTRQVVAINRKTDGFIRFEPTKKRCPDGSSVRVVQILPNKPTKDYADELPD